MSLRGLSSPESASVLNSAEGRGRFSRASRWMDRIAIEPIGDLSEKSLGPTATALVRRSDAVVLHLHLPTRSRAEIARMIPFQIERKLPVSLDSVRWATATIPTEGGTLVRVEIVRSDVLEALQVKKPRIASAIVDTWALVPMIRGLSQEPLVTAIVNWEGLCFWVTIHGNRLLMDEPVSGGTDSWRDTARELSSRLGMEIPEPSFHVAPEGGTLTPDELFATVLAENDEDARLSGAAAAILIGAPTLPVGSSGKQPGLWGLLASVVLLLASLGTLGWVDLHRQHETLRSLREIRAAHSAQVDSVLALRDQALRTLIPAGVVPMADVFESLRAAAGSDLHLGFVQFEGPTSFRFSGWAQATAQVLDFSSSLEADSLWGGVTVDIVRTQEAQQSVAFEVRASLRSDAP